MKKTILTLLTCSLFASNFFAQTTNEHFGMESLLNPLAGSYNTACGKKALMQNSGTGNSAFGYQSMKNNTAGFYNTAVGAYTLNSLSVKNENAAVGYKSQAATTSYGNTSLGFRSLQVTQGGRNVAIGHKSMMSSTGGDLNTAVGASSLFNATGIHNVGVGGFVLSGLSSGYDNIGLGYSAGRNTTTGIRNIFIGAYALGFPNSNYNIILGYRSIGTTGDNNIIIGKKLTLPAGTSNAMNIGGVLFGTGFQSALPQSATAAVSNGRIGINVVNPQAALDVNGNVSFQNSSLSMTRSSNEGPQIDLINTSKTAATQGFRWSLYNMTGAYGNSLQFWNYSQTSCASGGMCTSRFTIMDNGNVGIGVGTNAPTQALSVVGKIAIAPTGTFSDEAYNGNLMISKPTASGQYINLVRQGSYVWSIGTVYNKNIFAIGQGNANDAAFTSPFFTIGESGNVGIGTMNPQNALDVKGTIRATEIKVESVDKFADFVFDKDYDLPSLQEVNSFIEANGHLPNIPSAQEVKDNGMSLVEMQVKLLQKVEELTLYSIKQQEQIQLMQAQLESLKQK